MSEHASDCFAAAADHRPRAANESGSPEDPESERSRPAVTSPTLTDALFRAVFDDASHFAGILDPDGILQQANAAACAFIGCSPADVVGRPFWSTPWWKHSTAEQARLRDGVARAARGASVRFETTHLAADGGLCSVDFTLRPVLGRAGRVLALIAEAWEITERKKALEQVRRLASEQTTILDTITMGVCHLAARKLQWVNPAFAVMFGYDLAELAGLDSAQFYAHSEDCDRVGGEGYARLAHGEGYSTEALMKRKDRSLFWCNLSGRAIDRQHLEEGSIWVLQDITARREAEAALRSSQERLALALEGADLGIWDWDVSSGAISFNERWARMLGYRSDEIEPHVRSWEALVHPDDLPRVHEVLTAHLEGKTAFYEVEHRLRHKSGSWVWVLDKGKVIVRGADGTALRAAGTHLDITVRKREEEALRKSEERFKRLVQNSNDIIAVFDERGRFVSLSGPIEPVSGFTAEELVGRNGLDFVHPDDAALVKTRFVDVHDNAGAARRLECRFRHKRGNWIATETVGTNWLHDPVVNGVVLNIRDITERKTAELEREQLQGQLQHAMKMEAVGRLAGGIAHDFNNLLTVIAGNVELAREDLDSAGPVAQSLVEVSKAADSAASLTRQLLAFSRHQIIAPSVLDLNDLVRNLRKMLGRLIGEDVALETVLAESLGSVKVDPGQFEQILVNLAINARDAMPDGGRLSIETANVELDDHYRLAHPDVPPGNYVMLAVNDTGHGMDTEVKRRLFEPFFTTKPKGRGTGLGLAMIFGTVKQSGGSIDVYSEVGHGTTFKIYLPRTEEAAERLPQPSATSAVRQGTETILLVEDESNVRDLASTFLRRQGYTVLPTTDGDEALRAGEQHRGPIHLLMTDVVLPGMNGCELSGRIGTLHPETRVLFTSGYTEDVIVHHGVVDKDLSFIGKPYSMRALAEKVRQVLDAPPSVPEPGASLEQADNRGA